MSTVETREQRDRRGCVGGESKEISGGGEGKERKKRAIERRRRQEWDCDRKESALFMSWHSELDRNLEEGEATTAHRLNGFVTRKATRSNAVSFLSHPSDRSLLDLHEIFKFAFYISYIALYHLQ